MNDFTKEELELMYCYLANFDKTKELLKKIGSLILKYCDHDKLVPISYFTLECEKCGKVLDE
jgi:hypothetical protein